MNYRHAFHAGNFADVLKHVVLSLCLAHFRQKPAPFRVLDTHAGAGLYRLGTGLAEKTREWRQGVARLLGADALPLPAAALPLLAPWREAVFAMGYPATYPGSPALIRASLRAKDRLVATELHPSDRHDLTRLCRGDTRIKVLQLDGWTALKSMLPFPERRGLVLIDPPYEDREELTKLPERLREGLRRFATGCFIVWYPIKDPDELDRFHARIADIGKRLRADLLIHAPTDRRRLNGCGLLIINPPWTLAGQLAVLGPLLADRLATAPGAEFIVSS